MEDTSRYKPNTYNLKMKSMLLRSSGDLRLSVVIPVHRSPHRAIDAVKSVLSQTLRDLEVVIVDDGARTVVEEVIENISDPRVRVIHHSSSRGAAAARNSGVIAARAEVVAFLDSDDEWLPGMAESQLRALESAPSDVVGVTTAFFLVSGNHEHLRSLPSIDFLEAAVKSFLSAPGSTLAIRRFAWLSMGGENELMARLEDWDLFLRIAERGWHLERIACPLARIHHSTPGPRPEDVKSSCSMLRQRHYGWISTRSSSLAKHLDSRIAYEIGLASLRHGAWLSAIGPLVRSFGSDPEDRFVALLRAASRRLRVSMNNAHRLQP